MWLSKNVSSRADETIQHSINSTNDRLTLLLDRHFDKTTTGHTCTSTGVEISYHRSVE